MTNGLRQTPWKNPVRHMQQAHVFLFCQPAQHHCLEVGGVLVQLRLCRAKNTSNLPETPPLKVVVGIGSVLTARRPRPQSHRSGSQPPAAAATPPGKRHRSWPAARTARSERPATAQTPALLPVVAAICQRCPWKIELWRGLLLSDDFFPHHDHADLIDILHRARNLRCQHTILQQRRRGQRDLEVGQVTHLFEKPHRRGPGNTSMHSLRRRPYP